MLYHLVFYNISAIKTHGCLWTDPLTIKMVTVRDYVSYIEQYPRHARRNIIVMGRSKIVARLSREITKFLFRAPGGKGIDGNAFRPKASLLKTCEY